MARQTAPMVACTSHDRGISVGVSDCHQKRTASDEPPSVGGPSTRAPLVPCGSPPLGGAASGAGSPRALDSPERQRQGGSNLRRGRCRISLRLALGSHAFLLPFVAAPPF